MVSVVTLERHRAHAEVGGGQPDVDIGLHKQSGGRVTHPVRRDGLGQACIGDAGHEPLPDARDALIALAGHLVGGVIVGLDIVAMSAPHVG